MAAVRYRRATSYTSRTKPQPTGTCSYLHTFLSHLHPPEENLTTWRTILAHLPLPPYYTSIYGHHLILHIRGTGWSSPLTTRNFAKASQMICKTNVVCSERHSLQFWTLCWNKPVDVLCALLPLGITSCLTTTAIGADTVISARWFSWVAAAARRTRFCLNVCTNPVHTGLVLLPFSLTSGISQYKYA